MTRNLIISPFLSETNTNDLLLSKGDYSPEKDNYSPEKDNSSNWSPKTNGVVPISPKKSVGYDMWVHSDVGSKNAQDSNQRQFKRGCARSMLRGCLV